MRASRSALIGSTVAVALALAGRAESVTGLVTPPRAQVQGAITAATPASAHPLAAAAQIPEIGRGPQVKIVTPRVDQPLADPIVIQALIRATPGRSVVKVSAFLNDQELGVRNRPPFRWVVPRPPDTTAVHVRVIAVDDAGAESQVEEMITRTPGMRFSAEVPAVTLNLAAIDGNERFISNLRADEIVIRDNGEVQEVLDFAHAEAPLRISILVDRSRSMADKMDETLVALNKFLGQLGPDDHVKLMGFNQRITSYTPFTNMHDLVGSFAQAIEADGSTALFDAVLYGYRQLATFSDARERRVIFLMTDGDDQSSRTALEPALEQVRNGGVTIFALGQGEALDDGDLRDVLREMADETGGEAFFEKDEDKLDRVFEQIAGAMRALYLVSYRPTNPTPGWHGIEVEVKRPNLRLRHKPGYERTPGGSP